MNAGFRSRRRRGSRSAPTSAETTRTSQRLGLDIIGALAKRGDRQRQAFDARRKASGRLPERRLWLARGRSRRSGPRPLRPGGGPLPHPAGCIRRLRGTMQDRRAGRWQPVEVVEQDDPLARGGDQAGAVVARVREGASLVAEEDAAEQRLVGQLVARSDRQRGLTPLACRMKQGRQPALACAALTVEKQAGKRSPRASAAARRRWTRSRADGPGRRPGPEWSRTHRIGI